ncbi:putative HIRA-interacting protein 5 [Trypanosoma rangeli]|uniref:Putative HIRA-interacting protein 5 n=1 Tax=Trypanosoma rangeli TaxID=5698 RepID=A0A3R7MX73_TRYRA|nr:putative HIRA-interacting protein 5 [Trypanosoma rangeli]RNF09440.1 putative HIRA-interacting protein 5 [Trypanosoma rangeli]|eukprot:RNF09440.1 putative HIRA-interacting protein 5 [Trypanosoma rangeli]
MLRVSLSCLLTARSAARLCVHRRPLSSAIRVVRGVDTSTGHHQLGRTVGGAATPMWTSQRLLLVETSETPNPDCLRFYSMDLSFLQPGFSMDFPNAGHAYKSPLAEILFSIDGVEAVYLADEYVTIRKASLVDWEEILLPIKESITQFSESNAKILSEDGENLIAGHNDDTEPRDDDDEVILAVKELLATRIRPMLQADGGNVRYVDMDDGTVFVLLEGACKSCPSAGVTLKKRY